MMQLAKRCMVATVVIAVAFALLASSASAAQNVANTSQKGSIVAFPLIDVRAGTTTIVRISNDSNVAVDVKCYYMNETKIRRDVVFVLTKKQTVSWDVVTGVAEPLGRLPRFPTAVGSVPAGNPFLGELVCFAVNPAGSQQISHNHLSGTATVAGLDGQSNAYEYNSWNFQARGVARGDIVGTAGRLDLTGQNLAYDACPAYNIIHFSPGAAVPPATEHRLGVMSCLQDLRQDFTVHFTKLEFEFWNANEIKFTGSWECADSVESFLLSEIDRLADNASFDTLGTTAAYGQIRGVASTQCRKPDGGPSEAAGLLAVIARVNRPAEGVEQALHGTTTNHAGVSAAAGFILWDPQDGIVPEKGR